jgi:CheY-like chemotaxis protein
MGKTFYYPFSFLLRKLIMSNRYRKYSLFKAGENNMKSIKVLMVEDSQFAADINARHIKKSGFDVEYQVVEDNRTMKEAIEKKKWDLIISDNCMPNFSALGALEVWRQSNLKIPFIIVSEHMLEAEINRAYSLGLSAFVSKADLLELGIFIQKLVSFGTIR